MAKKLSTQDILAKARAESAKKSGEAAEPEPEAAAEQPAAEARTEQQPAAEAPAAPKSTADILAAARAQKAAKAEAADDKPAAAPAGEAPKSTADILAAARGQAGGAAKPASAPKSTADILAAARGGGAGAAAKPAAKGGAAKTAPKAAAPTADASGEKLSVQEMLSRVREGQPSEAASAPAKPALPPRPQKPPVPAKKKSAVEDRRFWLVAILLSPFALGWWMFGIASAAFTLAMARFMMPNVLIEPPSQFKIGPPSDYPPDTVTTKWKAEFGVWIINTVYNGDRMVYALSTVCTHLGCTPNWLEGEQKFKCPCHGSGFYINGINFEGPAPRPLERVGIQIAPDGMLEVDKSVKFQQEMGQWTDPKSFVPIA